MSSSSKDLLSTPEAVQIAGKLAHLPETTWGSSDEGDSAIFCTISGQAKYNIDNWLSIQRSNFVPTFARVLQKASKDLSDYSIYPTLGIDSTLPQYRPSSAGVYFPLQDQYPVWYFFYGTLADPVILVRQLSLATGKLPDLKPAKIRRGFLKTWAGKYRALVDGTYDSEVVGMAYLVKSKEHEDALREYEADNYEVVKCEILMAEDNLQPGCTFRFVGAFT